MSDVKWIKITTDIFDDEKIKLIDAMPEADTIIVIWFKLLAQAGKSNSNGSLYLSGKLAYTDEMLSTVFNRKVQSIRLALDMFEKLGMIERGDYIQISNWEKHQNIEGMEKIRLQTRERVRKHREKQQLIGTVEPVALSNVTVTHLEEELEVELEEEKEIKPKEKTKRFVPPTLEEVNEYCKSRNNTVDSEKWFNFYQAKGWYVGKNKMKDWKAGVRTWETKKEEVKSSVKVTRL